MDRSLAVLITVVAGGLIAFQAPINGRFGRTIGSFPAATISFTLGLLLLLAIVVVRGELGQLGQAAHVPWWYLLGGFMGAAYVTVVLTTVGTLGAGGVVAATILAQLTLSVVIDQFGLVGVEKSPVNPTQLVGIALLVVGVVLVVRK